MDELGSTQPAVSAAEITESAHASDLFVFRRVAEQRFAHVGGFGRGAGWAGIVEVGDEDPKVGRLLASANPIVRRSQDAPFPVIGPYYAKHVLLARLTHDVFVVFGGPDEAMAEVSDSEFLELSQFASDALVEVAPAKRLADEVEALNAVRDLLHAPAETFAQAAQHLVEQATGSLSCDLGLLYIEDGRRVLSATNAKTLYSRASTSRTSLRRLLLGVSFRCASRRPRRTSFPRPSAPAMASLPTTCSSSCARFPVCFCSCIRRLLPPAGSRFCASRWASGSSKLESASVAPTELRKSAKAPLSTRYDIFLHRWNL